MSLVLLFPRPASVASAAWVDPNKTTYAAASNGIVFDGRQIPGCSITPELGLSTLVSEYGAFVAGDVGKGISIPDAVSFGVAHTTTIASVVNARTITLTVAASVRVDNVLIAMGTDNFTAWGTLLGTIRTNGGGIVTMPSGLCFIGTQGTDNTGGMSQGFMLDLPSNFKLVGNGRDASKILTGKHSANVLWANDETNIALEDFQVIAGRAYADPFKFCETISNLTIRRCLAEGGAFGFQLIGIHQALIEDCIARNQVADFGGGRGYSVSNQVSTGVNAIDSHDIEIRDCLAYNTAADGFALRGASGIPKIYGVTLKNCISRVSGQNGGFYLSYATACRLERCAAQGALTQAFYLADTSDDNDLVDCVGLDSGTYGFNINGSSTNRLERPIARNNPTAIRFTDQAAVGSVNNTATLLQSGGTRQTTVVGAAGANSTGNTVTQASGSSPDVSVAVAF